MNVSLALVLVPLRLSSRVQLHGSQMSLEIVGKGPSSKFSSYAVPLAHGHRTEHLPLFDCVILAPALPFSCWGNFECLYQPPIVLNILHRFMSLKNLLSVSPMSTLMPLIKKKKKLNEAESRATAL